MFVELHMIQNFAPSNLNRDDTGNPKDTEFGGHRRARISSQCIKRAMRLHPLFAETTGARVGERTKWMTRPIKRALAEAGKPEEEAKAVAAAFAKSYAGKMDGKSDEKTSVLLYLSQEEIALIVDTLLQNWDTALQQAQKGNTLKELVNTIIKETKGRTSAPDIALFGRMLADKPELNIDAAAQVAHAISTHRVNMEMDYYTAVDDLQQLDQDEGAGAGMVGFTSFNSACFYRYARIDWNQLVKNLGGDVELAHRTIEGFLRAAVAAVPSGKQNAFAAQNPPSFLFAVVRNDGVGWSLANAFETPVRASGTRGYVISSIEALDNYWGRLARVYGDGSATAASLSLEDELSLAHLTATLQPNLSAWIETVAAALPAGEEA
jgi:CRISPR system Cascade subunit CasC